MLKVKKEYLNDLNIKVLDASSFGYEEKDGYLVFDEDSESDILNLQNSGNIFSGFLNIPLNDFVLFFIDNQKAIIEELKEWADGQGEGLLEMIAGFNNMKQFNISQIGEALFSKLSEQEVREYKMDLIPHDNPLNEIREGLGVAIFEEFLIFRLENIQENDLVESEE